MQKRFAIGVISAAAALEDPGDGAVRMDAQQKNAEQTVREFMRKWMLEQGKKSERPIRVVFNGPNPL